ncbi:MAG: DNA translocase FtsK 4TM domain-containing protein [Anaerolineae bacterium]|nr:DNA translocase FtsK 4TM domain-containing protein [Anaerolineae bacterium]
MAKINTPRSRGYSSRKKKQQQTGPIIRPEFMGTLMLILAGLTLLSLFTPNPGFFGAGLLEILRLLIGWGRYIFWVVLTSLAIWFFSAYSKEDADEKWEKPVGTFLILAMLLIAFHFIQPGNGLVVIGGGGIIGWVLGEMLRSTFGTSGTMVLLIGLIPVVIILISGLSFRELFQMIRDQYYRFQDWRHFRQLTIKNQPTYNRTRLPEPKTRLIDRMLPKRAAGAKAIQEKDPSVVIVGGGDDRALPASVTDQTTSLGDPSAEGFDNQSMGNGRWRLPPIAQIFDEGHEIEISEGEIRQRVKIIEETLLSFGVEAKVREINQGPAVTQFSLEPGYMATKDAKGNPRKVRVSRIVNLANDLALALAASPIRIEAPIPGRPYVGLEVPNSNTNLVTIRTVLESDQFQRSKGALNIALGQDVSGRPFVADLAAMPHLLIAGATGSGKSVCINAVVASFIAFHTPETLRFLMIDPKMVELVAYNGIPHLLAPVVTELEKATGVLSWATREMDRRYKLFAKEHTRNLEAYNEKMRKDGGETLPYIVIIIDELADLMMMAPDEVERTVARIAQMARATGMHLILATQRPSVDVVTGLIKANFPARIAFAVSSQIDSRVILDSPGAERLLGKGDMLYMAADSAKLRRLQGGFVSDSELNRLVQFWRGSAYESERRSRGPVEIPKDLVQRPLLDDFANVSEKDEASKEEDLLEKAIETVRTEGKASVSLLQRRLRIGYARAARLIDEMEAQGIIGADQGGGRARPILVTQADDDADPTADDDDDDDYDEEYDA